jgi:biopolymer transport protein ExbD
MHAISTWTADLLPDELVPRKRTDVDPHFDMTAMVDLVFMMNIFFLVTFVGAMLQEINLPAAVHCAPLDAEVATVITVVAGPDAQSVLVYLGDRDKTRPLTDAEEQITRIEQAVDAGAAQGKKAVLIKAEKNVRLREVGRLAAAAGREGVTLHLAVMEKDTAP